MSKSGRYSADRKKIESLTAAKTVEVSDCGTIFTLNLAGGFAVALPNASDAGNGWWCKFIVGTAPSGANYIINVTAADGDNLHGVTVFASGSTDTPASSLSDSTAGTAVDQINFVDGVALIGDQLELVCDGSSWFATAHTKSPLALTYD
tara:strand:+ start:729 stop:1175 length:447 start_codon:yes stop_codon:yes gene_type:complete